MIWQILLWSYLISAFISCLGIPVIAYNSNKKTVGIRKSFLDSIKIALCFLLPIVSYVGLVIVIYLIFDYIAHETNEWVKRDPTSPRNIRDPNFIPPPKKEKKFKAIKDRFELLDL